MKNGRLFLLEHDEEFRQEPHDAKAGENKPQWILNYLVMATELLGKLVVCLKAEDGRSVECVCTVKPAFVYTACHLLQFAR